VHRAVSTARGRREPRMLRRTFPFASGCPHPDYPPRPDRGEGAWRKSAYEASNRSAGSRRAQRGVRPVFPGPVGHTPFPRTWGPRPLAVAANSTNVAPARA